MMNFPQPVQGPQVHLYEVPRDAEPAEEKMLGMPSIVSQNQRSAMAARPSMFERLPSISRRWPSGLGFRSIGRSTAWRCTVFDIFETQAVDSSVTRFIVDRWLGHAGHGLMGQMYCGFSDEKRAALMRRVKF